jgi:hypothetical protein
MLTDTITNTTCPGMDTQNQPTDLGLQLPRDVYHLVVFTLRGMLPPPETDTPEAEARRDRGAIALVASMLPPTARRPTSPPAASASPFMRWTVSAKPGIIAATPRFS